MEAKELMTGDWFRYRRSGKLFKVTAIYPGMVGIYSYPPSLALVAEDLIDPIPPTAEILERNGFSRAGAAFVGLFEESYSNQTVEVSLFNVGIKERSIQLHIEDTGNKQVLLHMMQCDYIHELQHALRLCGIKKEIEL